MKKPDENVPLALTEAERNLILEDLLYTEDACASVIRATPSDQPVRFALDDWNYLDGCITAEAKDTRDRWLKKELDRLHARIRRLLERRQTADRAEDLSRQEQRIILFLILRLMDLAEACCGKDNLICSPSGGRDPAGSEMSHDATPLTAQRKTAAFVGLFSLLPNSRVSAICLWSLPQSARLDSAAGQRLPRTRPSVKKFGQNRVIRHWTGR